MNNKIAIVTGGSRGIGKNMAINLAQKGLDVIITYNSNKIAADEVVQKIIELGQNAVAFQLDTRDITTFDSFINAVTTYVESINGTKNFDYLINNAGTGLYSLATETSEEQVLDLFNIHFKGVFFLIQKALPYMNNAGGIINISSGLTRISMPATSVYASMKSAVETYSRILAKELGDRKIRVNVVAPGAIETDFGGGRTRDNKDVNAHIAGLTALGRVGLPADIGPVVAFLCTEDSYWINGQRIEVSGGQAL